MSDQRLRIDPQNIDDDLIENPSLVEEVNNECALAISIRDTKKDELKTVEAELDAELRDELSKASVKVTEKIVEAAVQTHPRRKEAFENWNEANLAAARAYALVQAVSTRSDSLKELSKLLIAGHYTINSVKSSTQEVQYNRARARLANTRLQK